MGNDGDVSFGVLIVFQMTTGAVIVHQEFQEGIDAEGTVFKVLALEGAGNFIGDMATATGKQNDAMGFEGVAEFLQYGGLIGKRKVKGAVPGGN